MTHNLCQTSPSSLYVLRLNMKSTYNQINNNLTKQITDDGFVLIRNLLSQDEIKQLRKKVKDYFNNKGVNLNKGLTQPNAAVEFPEISWIFYHPKILQVMSQLLGEQQIMFTSHCDIHCQTLSAWHKDDGMTVMDGGYFGQPMYGNEDCRVYKVAIYLQDHFHNNGGLTVRKGSHKYPSLDRGEEVYLKTKAGDAIVFDVRLTHTGQRDIVPIPLVKKPIGLFKRILNRLFRINYAKIDRYLKSIYDKISGERLSIFFTYGLPNEYTKSFAINNMKRQMKQNESAEIFLSPSTRQMFLDNKLLLAEDYFT